MTYSKELIPGCTELKKEIWPTAAAGFNGGVIPSVYQATKRHLNNS